jgi:endonuclease YncB( thermonuclease family)
MRYRCNRCHRAMRALTCGEDGGACGACACGGLIEADPQNFAILAAAGYRHTPGPWKVEEWGPDTLSIVVGENAVDWVFIAQVHADGEDGGPSGPEAEANAQLIACAWEIPQLERQRDELADALEDSLAALKETLPLFSSIVNREAMKERIAGHRESLRKVGRLAVFLVALLLPTLACAQTLAGIARVVDGDTLAVQGQKVRLWGIDAPEKRQFCMRPEWNGHSGLLEPSAWPCGKEATSRLRVLLSGRPVTCVPKDRDRYGRVVARCFVGQPHVDLSGWMVRQGLAVAYLKYSTDYVPQEAVARGARVGLWSGTFVQPSEWRKGVRGGH